jgi:hypothetical protein
LNQPAIDQPRRAYGFLITVAPGTPPTIHTQYWPAEDGGGSPLLSATGDNLHYAYLGVRRPDVLSSEWAARLLAQPNMACEMPGVFALAIIQPQTGAVHVFNDRLGVQAVFYRQVGDILFISTHLTWLLLASEHDGVIDEGGLLVQLGFGYGIAPQQLPYAGVHKLPFAGYLVADTDGLRVASYWQPPALDQTLNPESVPEIAARLDAAVQTRLTGERPFFGLTAGKDSLCILSTLGPAANDYVSGTYDVFGTEDHLQAKKLKKVLGWPHTAVEVCPPDDFEQWVWHIALHAAGLLTASYVDMCHFIDQAIPADSVFVMGEAGECVRDFFRSVTGNLVDTLQTKYTTPEGYLRATLAPHLHHHLDDYPRNIIAHAKRVSGQTDDHVFAVHFYRYQRMYGNFSQRHTVLSAIRPKLSPFLDTRFIDLTYNLRLTHYTDSALHRVIIAHSRPELLPFFDRPAHSNIPSQDWPRRFRTGIGAAMRRMFVSALPASADWIDAAGTLALVDAYLQTPDKRGMYYLMRLLSFVVGVHIVKTRPTVVLGELDARSITKAT